MREHSRFVFMTILLSVLTALGLLLAACQKQEPVVEESTEAAEPIDIRPWAILYAFDEEGKQLREWIPLNTDTVWAGRRVATGRYGEGVVIAASGMGMSNAAATAQYVIDTYNPKGIIFTGICGAIDPELHIGDLVIPSKWITHDFGYWGKDGFETSDIPVGRTDSAGFVELRELPVDTALYRKVTEAADRIDFRFRQVGQLLPELHVNGIGVSGDAFVDSKSKRLQLQREFNAQIVDMESAAVLQTALANGIPAVIIRSCSDLAGGSGSNTAGEELEQFYKVAAYNSALVVRDFIENPE